MSAADSELAAGRCGGRGEQAEASRCGDGGRTRLDQAERAGAGGGRVDPAQAVGEVALDVEVAADVGAGQAELARAPQEPL